MSLASSARRRTLNALPNAGPIEAFAADLSNLTEVEALADAVAGKHTRIDVLINNAGVFVVPDPMTQLGIDVRFVVNTIAPYLLTKKLLPLLGTSGRIVNLCSAAQSPVDPGALIGNARLSDGPAYAQSKLALTMWSCSQALSPSGNGPAMIAVNPGSMLATKWSIRPMEWLGPISRLVRMCFVALL